nr:ABC-ATPase domain-containing protein [Alteribacter populi]
MKQLTKKLRELDGKGYKALKSIQGRYKGDSYTLFIDYVQGDPFANPSKIRMVYPLSQSHLQNSYFHTRVRKVALEDFIARQVQRMIMKKKHRIGGTGKSGLIAVDAPGQEVIDRTTVLVSENEIDIRLSIGLPATGRRISGREAAKLMGEIIPSITTDALQQYSKNDLLKHLELADDQEMMRAFLKENDLVSFIANDSVLPRISGISNKPLLKDKVVPFSSPKAYERTIQLTNGKTVTGMAIPKGVTLIVGGGYHGKSTLLQAIERGIYNHVKGDGREFVITDESAMKIRSEDGRSVHKVNITPFISNLPFKKATHAFSSQDASGSTSQATNIMEALEMDAKALLIDEDTSATNFMIRDARMQKLVHQTKEPITPFLDQVRPLFDSKQISTIMVIGGSGDYFDVADNVIMMDEYKPYDKTKEAKQISKEYKNHRESEELKNFIDPPLRLIDRKSFLKALDRKEKLDVKGKNTILINRQSIDLSQAEQLVDPSQTRAIALVIKQIIKDSKGPATMKDAVEQMITKMENEGLEVLAPFKDQHPGDLALPRKHEIAAAFNRFRR